MFNFLRKKRLNNLGSKLFYSVVIPAPKPDAQQNVFQSVYDPTVPFDYKGAGDLAGRLQLAFPSLPVPQYAPQMGIAGTLAGTLQTYGNANIKVQVVPTKLPSDITIHIPEQAS
jgi:hypothetical protein